MDAERRSRSRTCASPIWSARGPRARARHEQVGPDRAQAGRGRQAARGGRSLAAAGQGRADRRGVRPARRGPRPADAGGGRRACGLEPARLDQRAQPLVRGCGVVASAAGGERAAASSSTTSRRSKARPPSFVLFCSRADAVPESYLRYLVNGLRETFDLPGTPIRITLAREGESVRGQEEEAAMSEVPDAASAQRAAAAPPSCSSSSPCCSTCWRSASSFRCCRGWWSISSAATRRARREVLGLFGTAWALMQFLFSPMHRRAVRPVRPPAGDPDLEYRARARLHPDGARAVAVVAVRRAGHFRHHGGEHLDGLSPMSPT